MTHQFINLIANTLPMSTHNNPEKHSLHCQSEQEHFIGGYEKAPEFMKDNLNITDGYRINFNTPSRILKSLFMVHNESVNIWTHCLAAVFIAFLLLSFLLVMDDHPFASLHQTRNQIAHNIHAFHQALSNLTQTQAEAESLKSSVMRGYHQMMENIDQGALNMRKIVETNLNDFKNSITNDLVDRLHAFEKSKRRFEQEVAPQMVEKLELTFDGQLVTAMRAHLEELKQHLDSAAFAGMELHGEIPNPQHVSKWPVFVFLLSAVVCLLNSTIFHLFHPISSKAYGLLLRFDFAGISLLIAGTAFPCLYYGMYCQMAVATLYLAWTFGAALLCFVICLFEWIHRAGNEKYRSVVFGSFGFSMAVPLTHMLINELAFDNHGDSYSFSSSGGYYALLISCYIFGLYVFTVRCPERSNPGRYNICGHSHQIWHVMVVLGIVFSYFAVMENFEMRKASACPV